MDTLYLLQFTCFLFMLVNILNLGITRLHMKWMNRRYEVSRWLVIKYVLGVSFPHEGDTFFVGMRHHCGGNATPCFKEKHYICTMKSITDSFA